MEKWPPQESPVAFKIITEDANKLLEAQTIAKELKWILKTIPGTSDIKINISNTPGEFTFKINRMEALSEIKRMNRKIAVTVSSQLTRDWNTMAITQAFYIKNLIAPI